MKKLSPSFFYLSKYTNGFILLFFYIIITNLPILLITWHFNASRPTVVLDYILIFPLMFFFENKFFRILFIILFILVYIVDCLIWVRQFFPFMRFEDILTLSQMLFDGPNIYKILIFTSLILFFLQNLILFKLAKRINIPEKKIGIVAGIILIIILYCNLPANKDVGMYETKGWINSQVLYVYRLKDNLLYNMLSWQANLVSSPFIPASYSWWPDKKLKHDMSKKTLLIVHESWGYSNNSTLNKEILQKFIVKKDNFVYFESGHISALGATIDGELRELCQLKSTNFNLKSIKNGFEECLPNQLKRRGYETYAFHSASSTIYDRSYWYKKVGFEKSTFFENVKNPILCYSFYGNCDSNLFSTVGGIFRKSNKSFVYWLTLNSHYPYDLKDLKLKPRINCIKYNMLLGSEECRNVQLTTQFIDQLAEMTSDISMKGVEVILVGDHEPPIFHKSKNYKIFKENSVSWIHFKVKT